MTMFVYSCSLIEQGNRISFLELLYKLRHNKQAFKALLYKGTLQAARKF